jgi:hydroxymethylglutaryl-CoA lyase
MLQGLGIETGIDLDAAIQIGQSITSSLGRVNESKAGRAILAKSENA